MKHSLQLLKMFLMAIIILPLNSYAQLVYTGADIDINNVKARINNQMSHFWNPANNTTGIYEVPKGSGYNTIYAGSMWIGGVDPGGNLHMAAETYNQSGDVNFYPGPLDTINSTAADPNTWNKIWKINKSEILNHIANWNTSGYIIPSSIADWPGNSPSGSNYNAVLAPFFDSNANGIYEPALGEFPAIKGDQAIYFICNDSYQPSALGVPTMGIQILGMAYAFNTPSDPALNNTVFFKYQIANYSGIDYHDVYIGLWTDFDVGNAADDYFGTDAGRNMVYGYDAAPQSVTAAQGVKFLSPLLTNSMYFKNQNGIPQGNPAVGDDFYDYLTSHWIDGQAMTFGGDGRGSGCGATSSVSSFAYPATTDPSFPGQNWTMAAACIQPDDMRGTASTGPLTLLAGDHIDLELAYITGFASLTDPSNPLSAISTLQTSADSIAARYANGTLTSIDEIKSVPANDVHLSPSLVDNQTKISFDKIINGIYSADIISADGKTVQSFQQLRGNAILNLSQLSTGIYIVKITSANTVMTGRIMKK